MTDLEILAELKTAYLYLEDIIENQMKQITENEEKYIRLSMQNLEILYKNIYGRTEKENKKSLIYKEDIKIAPFIYLDYIDSDYNYISAGDLNWEKWWENYDFQTK